MDEWSVSVISNVWPHHPVVFAYGKILTTIGLAQRFRKIDIEVMMESPARQTCLCDHCEGVRAYCGELLAVKEGR